MSTLVCGVENPDYPGEYACELPQGHAPVDLDGDLCAHAAPSVGAWWNLPEPTPPAPPTTLPITHVPLAPFDNQFGNQRRAGSRDDRIKPDAYYLVRIYDVWYLGKFREVWYGWNFENWGTSGIQLDSIKDLYEVDLTVLS